MTSNVPDKIVHLLNELESNGFLNTTRLTVLKKWFDHSNRLIQFTFFIAKKAISQKGKVKDKKAIELFKNAKTLFNDNVNKKNRFNKILAEKLLDELKEYQNDYKKIPFGVARIIRNQKLLLIEKAIKICLYYQNDVTLGYQLATDYFRTYAPSHGDGIYSNAIYKIQELLQFMFTIEALEDQVEISNTKRK
jgi:hypothetical protein